MKPRRLLSSEAAEQELQDLGGIPIDRVAWRVVGKGEHFTSSKKVTQLVFDCQPPLRTMNRGKYGKSPENLKGVKWGRLEVVGYWGPRLQSNRGAVDQIWVCRCSCGLYVTRRGKTIKRQADPDDKCDQCRHLAYLIRREQWLRTGKNLDEQAGAKTSVGQPTNVGAQ